MFLKGREKIPKSRNLSLGSKRLIFTILTFLKKWNWTWSCPPQISQATFPKGEKNFQKSRICLLVSRDLFLGFFHFFPCIKIGFKLVKWAPNDPRSDSKGLRKNPKNLEMSVLVLKHLFFILSFSLIPKNGIQVGQDSSKSPK